MSKSIEQLQGDVEAARERLRIARTEGDHEDQVRGLRYELQDAERALREAGRAALQAPHALYVGEYEDELHIGDYASRELALQALGQWVLDGKSAEYPRIEVRS